MRILFLTHAFNSLTQRLFVELTRAGHQISIEFDINDAVSIEAAELFQPDLILAPYLRRRIPDALWRRIPCFVVHPGIPGDRGPSALDWAILRGEASWGVTVLQADEEMDAGDIWASVAFPMRAATKSSLYRREVTEAAVEAVLLALSRFASGTYNPAPLDSLRAETPGQWNPLTKQSDRAIDWSRDDSATIFRKMRAADGFPGVFDTLRGEIFALFDAHPDETLRGRPGEILGQRHGAICRATVDGAVWITHLKPIVEGERTFKQPAAAALGERIAGIPEIPEPEAGVTWRDIWCEQRDGVAYLHFPFYNGAMSTDQAARLEAAYRQACQTDTRLIVLMGGADFWSNGMHLGAIEAADSPAEESWRNINAIDDLCHAILTTESHLTFAVMRGNAGAGGVFLALAADRVVAAQGTVLNPHYKNMGNLYGSEYWTYLLPKRVGGEGIDRVMGRRLPLGAPEARDLGLIDDCLGTDRSTLDREIRQLAEAMAQPAEWKRRLREKARSRQVDEDIKSLSSHRSEELARMRLNFFGFDPSYHIARSNFMRKIPISRTPLHLAHHRS